MLTTTHERVQQEKEEVTGVSKRRALENPYYTGTLLERNSTIEKKDVNQMKTLGDR